MNRIFDLLPELEGEEMAYVQQAIKDLNDDDARTFANIYRARRRDPQTVLILSLVGLLAIPGAQRFYLGQIGMGILYLFTAGLCFIGSLIDLINYKTNAQEYNQKVAREVISIVNNEISRTNYDN